MIMNLMKLNSQGCPEKLLHVSGSHSSPEQSWMETNLNSTSDLELFCHCGLFFPPHLTPHFPLLTTPQMWGHETFQMHR